MQLIDPPSTLAAPDWRAHIQRLKAALDAGQDVAADLAHAGEILKLIEGGKPDALPDAVARRLSAIRSNLAL